MESSEDVEVLSRAIEKLLHEKRKREASGVPFIEDDDDDQLLLSTLISQLESPKPGGKTVGTTIKEEEDDQEEYGDSSPSKGKQEGLEESIEEIAKDIKEVKRQNTVTHVLLSVLIVLTLTWQVSEYSMISMMKDRLSHPIRSIGGMLSGMFKGKIRPIKNQLQGTSNSKDQNNHNNGNGSNTGVHIQVPELLREFGFDDDEE